MSFMSCFAAFLRQNYPNKERKFADGCCLQSSEKNEKGIRCRRVAISSISQHIVFNSHESTCSMMAEDVLVVYEIGSKGEFEVFDVACGKFSNEMAAPLTVFARPGAESPRRLEAVCLANSRIEHAIFLKSRVGDEMALQLARALANGCKQVRALAFSHSRITAQGAQWLSKGLQLHAALRVLDLSHNRCGSTGAESLAALVRTCPALKTLRLRDNRIGQRGATALAAALKPQFPITLGGCRGVGLEILDLSINLIGDNGAIELAAALGSNRSLVALDVSRNSVTVVGAERLADAMECNRTLRWMLVRAAAVGAEEEAALEALRRRVEGRQCAHW